MRSWFFILICICILLTVLFAPGSSQTKSNFTWQDTTFARQLFNKARELNQKAKYDSSITCLHQANQIYQELAQRANDPKMWEMYIKGLEGMSQNLIDQSKYDAALDFLASALKFGSTKLAANHPTVCKIYLSIGSCYFGKLEYSMALEYYQKALELAIKIFGQQSIQTAILYNNFGTVYHQQANYDKALEYYQKSLALTIEVAGENHPSLAKLYLNIGFVFYIKGNYDMALSHLEKSITIILDSHGPEHPQLINNYNKIGNIYYYKTDFENALKYYLRSLSLALKNFGNEHPSVAHAYNNIGMIYFEKKLFKQALDYYNQSLAIKLKSLGENHPDVANTYNNISLIYFETEEFDKALELCNKSLAIRIKTYSENDPINSRNYNNLGKTYHRMKHYDQAIEYFLKAIQNQKMAFGQFHPDIADIYNNLASVYYDKNDWAHALNGIQQAIGALIPEFQVANVYDNPPLEKMGFEPVLINTLILKGKILAKIFEQTSHKTEDLQAALKAYQLGINLLGQIRISYKAEGSKFLLGEESLEAFEKGIQVALNLHKITQEKHYLEIAFSLAEKAKASILLASLRDSRAKHFAGIPDSLLEQEKDLKIELTYFDTHIQKEQEKGSNRDSLRLRELQDQYFMFTARYQQLIETLEKDYPDYFNLKYTTKTALVSDLQEILDNKTSMLEYFIGDNLIYTFIIKKTHFTVQVLEKGSLFSRTLQTLNTAIKKMDIQKYTASSFALYQQLMAPLATELSSIEKLIIIPHSILYKIPFEVLISRLPPAENQFDFTKYDFLINRFEIAYHYSASLYWSSFRELPGALAEAQQQKAFIGFAPIFSDEMVKSSILAANLPPFAALDADSNLRAIFFNGTRFNELPYSENEIKQIVQLYENQKQEALGYFHTNASEANFKTAIGEYNLVHVATHGIINEERPQLSGIIFSQPVDSTETEDGILYTAETYNLSLNADLVVLSSCESGTGKLIRGEGLMALTRGFLFSGTANLVVSLWKIDDKSTAELMVEFYKNILTKMSYSQALRQAKLKLIQNPLTAFPNLWSGFVLIGT